MKRFYTNDAFVKLFFFDVAHILTDSKRRFDDAMQIKFRTSLFQTPCSDNAYRRALRMPENIMKHENNARHAFSGPC